MPTLKQVNAHIQKKYPKIAVAKGKGYFYIYSDDDDMGLKVAGLYTTSINVFKVSELTLGGWMDSVEYLLKDSGRLPFDRSPII